jgi:hypothetical protein
MIVGEKYGGYYEILDAIRDNKGNTATGAAIISLKMQPA